VLVGGLKQTFEAISVEQLHQAADDLKNAIPDSANFDALLKALGNTWIKPGDIRSEPGPHYGTLTGH
jgi:hypothetical protein